MAKGSISERPLHDKQGRISQVEVRTPTSYESKLVLSTYWQDQIPLWVLIFLFLLVLLVPMEIGFRLGLRHKRSHPNPDLEAGSDVTVTAMLTLLALMLAFTYSFSMSRADLRKRAIVTEVSALKH